MDLQEYFDSTNPESNPQDDIFPDDFDGDGIPDAVENQTGTDWRNPDTDGGGMLDEPNVHRNLVYKLSKPSILLTRLMTKYK